MHVSCPSTIRTDLQRIFKILEHRNSAYYNNHQPEPSIDLPDWLSKWSSFPKIYISSSFVIWSDSRERCYIFYVICRLIHVFRDNIFDSLWSVNLINTDPIIRQFEPLNLECLFWGISLSNLIFDCCRYLFRCRLRSDDISQFISSQHVLQREETNRHRNQLVIHWPRSHNLPSSHKLFVAKIWSSKNCLDIFRNCNELHLLCITAAAGEMAC